MAPIDGCVAVHVNATGWDAVRMAIMPSKMFAKYYLKHAIKIAYANRPWPEKPVVMIMPNGNKYRAFGDGRVEKWL